MYRDKRTNYTMQAQWYRRLMRLLALGLLLSSNILVSCQPAVEESLEPRSSSPQPQFLYDNLAGLTGCENYCIDGVELGQSEDEALAALKANDGVHSVVVNDGCVSGIADAKCIRWSSSHFLGQAVSIQSVISLVAVDLRINFPLVQLVELMGEPDHIGFEIGPGIHSDYLEGRASLEYVQEGISAIKNLHGSGSIHGLTEQTSMSRLVFSSYLGELSYPCHHPSIVQWRGYGGEGVYFDERGDIIDPIGDEYNCEPRD